MANNAPCRNPRPCGRNKPTQVFITLGWVCLSSCSIDPSNIHALKKYVKHVIYIYVDFWLFTKRARANPSPYSLSVIRMAVRSVALSPVSLKVCNPMPLMPML